MIINIINKNNDKKIYIAVDSLGKEELFIILADFYNTKIIVNNERYKKLKLIDHRLDVFTLDKNEGWIEIIKKSERDEKI